MIQTGGYRLAMFVEIHLGLSPYMIRENWDVAIILRLNTIILILGQWRKDCYCLHM